MGGSPYLDETADFAPRFSQFALVEFKAILSVLIDAFEFWPRDSETHVERRSVIVTRPLLVGEEDHGNKMPLRIRLAKRDD